MMQDLAKRADDERRKRNALEIEQVRDAAEEGGREREKEREKERERERERGGERDRKRQREYVCVDECV